MEFEKIEIEGLPKLIYDNQIFRKDLLESNLPIKHI